MEPSDAADDVPASEPAAALEPEPVTAEAAAPAALAPPYQSLQLPLLTLLLACLLAFLFLGRKRFSRARKLVVFGPIGGGKSALFHRLRYGRVVPTYSSIMCNRDTFAPVGGEQNRPLAAVDVPGSGRLRALLLTEAADATALVCVIDGTQLAAHAKEAAGALFDVLDSDAVAKATPPLLIAVNKSDKPGAVAPLAARKALETEIQRVRLARTTMADTSGKSKAARGISDDSQGPFSFDHLRNQVDFASISATTPAVEPLLEFIAAKA